MRISFSKCRKLDDVLNTIYSEMLSISDTQLESFFEIKRFMKEFPDVEDYNLYGYGCLRFCNEDIRELYKDYKSLAKVSDDKLISVYKRQIGWMARYIVRNFKF